MSQSHYLCEFRRWFLVFAWLGLAGVASAEQSFDQRSEDSLAVHDVEDSNSESSRAATLDDSAIESLVLQLGSNTYKSRERATKRLIALGMLAMPHVQSALSHNDYEIRLRCRRIARIVLTADRSRRLASFLATESEAGEALPGWQRVRGLLGSGPNSRRILVDILSEQWQLIEDFESAVRFETEVAEGRHVVRKVSSDLATADQKSATSLVAAQLEKLKFRRGKQHAPLSTPQLTALLIMAHEPLSSLDVRQSTQLLSVLHRFSRSADGSNPWENSGFCQLAGAYVQNCTERMNAYQACTLALRYNIKQGLVPALALVENRTFAAHEQQYGILALAKLGGREHIEVLETLFGDERVCFPRPQKPNTKNQECQLRDVALAAAIFLGGDDPRDYGYDKIRPNSYSVFQLNSLHFADEKAREAAFAKWESRRADR